MQCLGDKGKICQIHMRNINGPLHDFEEVYPDEGVIDFFESCERGGVAHALVRAAPVIGPVDVNYLSTSSARLIK